MRVRCASRDHVNIIMREEEEATTIRPSQPYSTSCAVEAKSISGGPKGKVKEEEGKFRVSRY